MHTFTDTAGRSWELSITIGACKRVKGILGVDLLDLSGGNPPLITRLHTDAMLLVDVIYAVLKPAANAAGITDEQFGEALGGDAAWQAYLAFAAELEDFFRRFHRPDQERTVAINRRLMETKPAKAAEYVERAAAAAENQTEKQLEEAMQLIEKAHALVESGSIADPWQRVYELAGIVGLLPDPLTLRELAAMARGRQREAWDRTAHLLAKLHNVNQTHEEGLLRPIDFHPYYDDAEEAAIEEAARPPRERGSVAALTALLTGCPLNPEP